MSPIDRVVVVVLVVVDDDDENEETRVLKSSSRRLLLLRVLLFVFDVFVVVFLAGSFLSDAPPSSSFLWRRDQPF